jgi:hypothetical protein
MKDSDGGPLYVWLECAGADAIFDCLESKTGGIRTEPVLSRQFTIDQLEPGGSGLGCGAYLLGPIASRAAGPVGCERSTSNSQTPPDRRSHHSKGPMRTGLQSGSHARAIVNNPTTVLADLLCHRTRQRS